MQVHIRYSDPDMAEGTNRAYILFHQVWDLELFLRTRRDDYNRQAEEQSRETGKPVKPVRVEEVTERDYRIYKGYKRLDPTPSSNAWKDNPRADR